jgi:exopolysaccharide biosynthesis polyprenyl glycosylphosphotransferase
MKNSSSLAYSFILLVGDFAALLIAFVLAYILRVTLDSRSLINQISSSDYLKLWLILIPIWLIIFAVLGLYQRRVYEYRWREMVMLLTGSVLGIMTVITVDFASERPIFPARLVPVYGLILGFLFLVLERTILRATRIKLWSTGFGVNKILLIGEGKTLKSIIKGINKPSRTGYKIVAIATEKTDILFKGKKFSNSADALAQIQNLGVHTILVAGIPTNTKNADEILAAAQANHTAFKYIPTHDGILNNKIEVELFQGLPVVSVHQTALTGWGRIIKRLFDIFASLVALVIASPFMLVVWILIKVSSPGPAIFKQTRLTRFNTYINIYKFRTMKQEYSGLSPEEAFAKMGKPGLREKYRKNGDHLPNDPRVSSIGLFLRKTSLDELPQLVNVFKGDISLVGPRALVPQELKNYPYKSLILSVKSGLTGLAQISGRRDIDFNERRALDLFYVQNWSFWLDIKILFRTVIDVLGGRGAK